MSAVIAVYCNQETCQHFLAILWASLGKSEEVWVFLNISHGANDSETCLLEKTLAQQKVRKSACVHERGTGKEKETGTKGSQRMSISSHNEHKQPLTTFFLLLMPTQTS